MLYCNLNFSFLSAAIGSVRYDNSVLHVTVSIAEILRCGDIAKQRSHKQSNDRVDNRFPFITQMSKQESKQLQ